MATKLKDGLFLGDAESSSDLEFMVSTTMRMKLVRNQCSIRFTRWELELSPLQNSMAIVSSIAAYAKQKRPFGGLIWYISQSITYI